MIRIDKRPGQKGGKLSISEREGIDNRVYQGCTKAAEA